MQLIRRPVSKFLRIACAKCRNEQIIFNKAAGNIRCLVCGAELAQSTGGKARIKARILQVLD